MSRPSRGHAELSAIERFVWKARDLYFRVDGQVATVLAIIALLSVGMFFVVVSAGEYHLNR